MLGSAPLMTMLPVVDMNRARSFHEEKLGLSSLGSNAQGNFLCSCAGATIALYARAAHTRSSVGRSRTSARS